MIVQLAFDPQTESDEIREVFENDTARTLWLGVKRGHLTSMAFSQDCLAYAKVIDQRRPMTARSLFNLLSGWTHPAHGIIGSEERDFAAELLPFVNGEDAIEFEVLS